MISIVRLVILLKLNHESPDLDYDNVSLSSWSIAESNMAIVAGVVLVVLLERLKLIQVTACLPSLRPFLYHIFHSQSRPLARSPSDNTFSRSEIRHNPLAIVQSHQRSTSISESQRELRDSLDDEKDFTGMKPTYEATIRSEKDRNSRDSEDPEMQRHSTRIHLRLDMDVTYEQKQNEGTIIT